MVDARPTRRSLVGGGLLLAGGWAVATAWGHRPVDGPPGVFLGRQTRATLVAALEVLLPDGAPASEVADDVDRFLAGSDPVLGGQLALALGLLEHLGGTGILRFARFSRRPRAERAQVLDAWQRSGFGAKRQVAAAIRKVALFSWYARPATWGALGYDGPWVGR
ncbi:MAG: hypothetical protein ABMB14_04890 [Myxococcota bacterium]